MGDIENLEKRTRKALIELREDHLNFVWSDGRPSLVIPAKVDYGYNPAVVWRKVIDQYRDGSKWCSRDSGRVVALGFAEGAAFRNGQFADTYILVTRIPQQQRKVVEKYLTSQGIGLEGIDFVF